MTEPLKPAFSHRQPPGEDKPRDVCDHCGFIDYRNPKIVAGAVVAHADAGRPHGEGCVPLEDISILLCKRAIFPRQGYWTLPAGFMELNETTEAAACRETLEEAGATIKVEIDQMLAVYDIVHRGQVHIYRRGELVGDFAAGEESLEVRLFRWSEIPWDDLAFETVHWALHAWLYTREQVRFAPAVNPGISLGETEPGESLPENFRYPTGERLRLHDRVRIGYSNFLHGTIVGLLDTGEFAEGFKDSGPVYNIDGWDLDGGVLVETKEAGLIGYARNALMSDLPSWKKIS